MEDINKNYNFVQVLLDSKEIKQISNGFAFAIVLKSNGEVLVGGNNYSGQLGVGKTEGPNSFTLLMKEEIKFVTCGAYFTFIYKNNGELLSFGKGESGQLV